MDLVPKIQFIIGRNLRSLRESAGFTQEEVAARAEIPTRTYQDIERGKSWPQKPNVEAICTAFQIEESTLFADPDSVPKTTPLEAIEILKEALEQKKVPEMAPYHPKQQRLIDLILRMPVEELEHFGIDRTLTKRLRELKLIDGDLQSPDRGSKIGD